MSEQKTQRTPNRLIHSTSPYLLQHAHNPVDWYEWGEEALAKAKENDIPILVSIGYSSCHWCHVMERESFENEQIAALMNEHFVCIKVDREERPDIDQVYMDAIQAMGMNGGWPLNVFVTPDQKPFFGGTYFNPQSWLQLLTNITNAYEARREDIESTSEELSKHLQKSNLDQITKKSNAAFKEDLNMMYSSLESQFDHQWGGLKRAPKFILPSVWHWLLRYGHIAKDALSVAHVVFTLKKIAAGGIYDHVVGGFARYSVDERWFAPHFEKMLYDNAQLMSLYSEAYKVSKAESFKQVVFQTFDWLTREMTSDEGGFYSALDADSEGIEGKFYTWTKKEFDEVLGNNSALMCNFFGVTAAGNWEGNRNILITDASIEEFASQNALTLAELQKQILFTKETLLKIRSKRIRPGLDDKILTGWNAMMVIGLLDAYDAFGDHRFEQAGIKNLNFLIDKLTDDLKVFRSYRGKRSNVEGFLDDYAYLIKALIKAYQTTFDEDWLMKAKSFTTYVMEHFFDPDENYFHYSGQKAEKLIARRKELFDNVIPSSNSVMAQNLLHLGIIFDNEWKETARRMVSKISGLIASEPVYMSNWGIVAMELNHGMAEVAFTGKNSHYLRKDFGKLFQPFTLFMGTETQSTLPLLRDKTSADPTIYVCYNKTCKLPVHSITEAVDQLQ